MLSYEEAIDYIYSFIDYSAVRADKYSPETFGLARMVKFLAALGNPQDRYPVLHVAGTKGKGSVAAMSASALRAGGYHTGFYTSPHLLDFCERAQVDGQFIPRAAVAEIVDELQPVVAQYPGLNLFEITTALAFIYFALERVDVVDDTTRASALGQAGRRARVELLEFGIAGGSLDPSIRRSSHPFCYPQSTFYPLSDDPSQRLPSPDR